MDSSTYGLRLFVALALLAALPAACKPGDRSRVSAGGEPKSQASREKVNATGAAKPAPPPAPPAAESLRRFIGSDWDEDWILDKLKNARARSFESVGNTSVVFKVGLDAPFDAAFKAQIKSRPRAYLAEVAAYRLARCLGLNNAPPAFSRRIDLQTLRQRLNPTSAPRWPELSDRLSVGEDGKVRGAAIFWIRGMRDLKLENRAAVAEWSQWLKIDGALPDDRRSLAADISNMLSFDYLSGNPDRFSGGNIQGDAESRRIYLRDYDLAFPRRLPEPVHKRLVRRMLSAERFSRALFQRVSDLTPQRLRLELARDPESEREPILDERQIRGVFDRRDAFLSHINSLISLYGMDQVLIFP